MSQYSVVNINAKNFVDYHIQDNNSDSKIKLIDMAHIKNMPFRHIAKLYMIVAVKSFYFLL